MMKKLKKALSLTLVLALFLALAAPAFAAELKSEQFTYVLSNEPVGTFELVYSVDDYDDDMNLVGTHEESLTVYQVPHGTVITSADSKYGLSLASVSPEEGIVGGLPDYDEGFTVEYVESEDGTEYSAIYNISCHELPSLASMTMGLDKGICVTAVAPTAPAEPTEPAEPAEPADDGQTVVDTEPPAPSAPTAPIPTSVVLSPQKLAVDGEAVECEKYNIDGSNYFKLRDLAQVLNGTGSQFGVGFDAETSTVTITTGEAYESTGTELAAGVDNSATTQPSAQSIQIDGTAHAELTVYNIGGSNFFQLRELGNLLGFEVGYDGDTNTATVTSAQK